MHVNFADILLSGYKGKTKLHLILVVVEVLARVIANLEQEQFSGY